MGVFIGKVGQAGLVFLVFFWGDRGGEGLLLVGGFSAPVYVGCAFLFD